VPRPLIGMAVGRRSALSLSKKADARCDADERGVALNFLSNTLQMLGHVRAGTHGASDGGKLHFALRLFAPPFRPSDLCGVRVAFTTVR
jgi:hypothetical protein